MQKNLAFPTRGYTAIIGDCTFVLWSLTERDVPIGIDGLPAGPGVSVLA